MFNAWFNIFSLNFLKKKKQKEPISTVQCCLKFIFLIFYKIYKWFYVLILYAFCLFILMNVHTVYFNFYLKSCRTLAFRPWFFVFLKVKKNANTNFFKRIAFLWFIISFVLTIIVLPFWTKKIMRIMNVGTCTLLCFLCILPFQFNWIFFWMALFGLVHFTLAYIECQLDLQF